MGCKPLIFIYICFVGLIYGQFEDKPWERLGLSQTEWKLINDNNIPISKVNQLLMDGVSIHEYLDKPWVGLEMTEDKWMNKRRSGMTSYDIELECREHRRLQKGDLKFETQQDVHRITHNGDLFTSLFLPGCYQFQTNQKAKGAIMVSLVASSLIWCTASSISRKRFDVVPVVFVLVPDMVWSFIDYKISLRKERNPE